jgi:methyl-accepting chemotaxis protein
VRIQMTLKTRLLVIGAVMTILPLMAASFVTFRQNGKMARAADEECTKLAYADLDHIAQNVYAMCQSQQDLVQQGVDHALNIAKNTLQAGGPVHLGDETVAWTATNSSTDAVAKVTIPKMMVGSAWLGINADANQTSPVVDTVQAQVGATCTIFQKMNDAGDMLRVCTNVRKKTGERAIGTYLPVTQADGTPNSVLAAVLKGQTYRGSAVVVGRSYITAYEPIVDAKKNIIGMLYVGMPQDSDSSIRHAITSAKVGKTGYVYVLDSKGNYIVSKEGKRDGECLWEAKDASGNHFIQDICRKTTVLKSGEIAELRYPWKNEGDTTPREKIARLVYFQPWDWVIGVSSYTDEFYEARDRVSALGATSNSLLALILGISVLTTSVLWYVIARGIAGNIQRVIVGLSEGAEQVASASTQVSSASQSLAEGATEQAAGLQETSSSLEEMSSMTRQSADNAAQANTLASEAKKSAHAGSESMSRMNAAIQDIQKSSGETSKIIKVIDEIAFQTNLLALNAAVEAARAGEAGKGFAVVAEEVRNLAMRSAEAAKNTSNLIEDSVKNAKNGVDIAAEVSKVLDEIVQSVGKTTDLVSEIAAASQEQAQGIDQVNKAVSQMDKVTQQNAANAEQSASASQELSAQAANINGMVAVLAGIVQGTSQGRDQAGQQDHGVLPQMERSLASEKKAAKPSKSGSRSEVLHEIAG